MKAKVEYVPGETFQLTAYEKGDEPANAVDVPPTLVNEWQKAEVARQDAIYRILKHLEATGQPYPPRT